MIKATDILGTTTLATPIEDVRFDPAITSVLDRFRNVMNPENEVNNCPAAQ